MLEVDTLTTKPTQGGKEDDSEAGMQKIQGDNQISYILRDLKRCDNNIVF